LSFESSQTEQVSVPTGSTLLRVGLIAGAGVVVSAVIGGLAVLVVSGKRRRPAPPEPIAT